MITFFLYTTDKAFAENKAKEILDILQITEVSNITAEPYWKFDDMYEVNVETAVKSFPKTELLAKIADFWYVYPDDILTSDTSVENDIDNKIYVSDTAMIVIYFEDCVNTDDMPRKFIFN